MNLTAALIPLLGAVEGPLTKLPNPSPDIPLPQVMLMLGVIFAGTLAVSKFSLKLGIPAILGVLLLGLAVNPGTPLIDAHTIERIHVLSLCLLLFYAGLKTDLKSIRGFLSYGLILSLGGVVVSSTLLGLFIWFVASPTASTIQLGFSQVPIAVGMLIAACLGSTDAGATLSVLRDVRHLVPARLSALLEFESSVNDPSAILFLGMVIGMATIGNLGQEVGATVIQELKIFLQSIGTGMICGLILGYASRFALSHLVHEKSQLLVLGVAVAMFTYGVSSQLGGSGFISVYTTGLFLGNTSYVNEKITSKGLEDSLLPFNTMTEIIVFFCFGLIMNPSRLLTSLQSGVVTALFLMFIARPVSVFLFQSFSPFRLRDSLFVSWCGLRGAVPLALTYEAVTRIPEIPGIDPMYSRTLADNATGTIFCVVLISLLVQGFSLQYVCRWLQLDTGANQSDPDAA